MAKVVDANGILESRMKVWWGWRVHTENLGRVGIDICLLLRRWRVLIVIKHRLGASTFFSTGISDQNLQVASHVGFY